MVGFICCNFDEPDLHVHVGDASEMRFKNTISLTVAYCDYIEVNNIDTSKLLDTKYKYLLCPQ